MSTSGGELLWSPTDLKVMTSWCRQYKIEWQVCYKPELALHVTLVVLAV